MTFFTQSGDAFFPTAGKDTYLQTLPVGNYTVVKDPNIGMFFQKADDFGAPGKTYGNLDDRSDRILHTFLDRERATGVLLAGEKGSGKSLLARVISYKAYELQIPTILINHPWSGDQFNTLLASIEQPAIVMMDEFEKVYNKREFQEAVLTLLDGTMTTKKLFLLTVNDKWAVNDHMRNRPGRLFYALDFDGLGGDFVEEYCKDNLDNHEHIQTVVRVSTLFERFNFDMLKALVEEMNRYDEDPFEALAMLNAKPVSGETYDRYDLKAWDAEGVEMETSAENYSSTPLASREGLDVYIIPKGDDDEDEDSPRARRRDWIEMNLTVADVVKIDGPKGYFEFKKDGYKLVFTKKQSSTTNLRALAAF